MAFDDLRSFQGEPIVLPIEGKEYSFPGEDDISGETWLQLQKIMDSWRRQELGEPASVVLTNAEEEALRAELMGEGQAALIADKVSTRVFKHVLMTLMVYHMRGKQVAEHAWNSRGEALTPSPQKRPQKKKATSRPRGSRSGSNNQHPQGQKEEPSQPGPTS